MPNPSSLREADKGVAGVDHRKAATATKDAAKTPDVIRRGFRRRSAKTQQTHVKFSVRAGRGQAVAAWNMAFPCLKKLSHARIGRPAGSVDRLDHILGGGFGAFVPRLSFWSTAPPLFLPAFGPGLGIGLDCDRTSVGRRVFGVGASGISRSKIRLSSTRSPRPPRRTSGTNVAAGLGILASGARVSSEPIGEQAA